MIDLSSESLAPSVHCPQRAPCSSPTAPCSSTCLPRYCTLPGTVPGHRSEAVQGPSTYDAGMNATGSPSGPPNLRLHREHTPDRGSLVRQPAWRRGGAVRPRQVGAVRTTTEHARRGVRVAGTSGGGGGVGVGGRRIVTTAREVRSLDMRPPKGARCPDASPPRRAWVAATAATRAAMTRPSPPRRANVRAWRVWGPARRVRGFYPNAEAPHK